MREGYFLHCDEIFYVLKKALLFKEGVKAASAGSATGDSFVADDGELNGS